METDVTPQNDVEEPGNFASAPYVYSINAMELVELCNQGFITKKELRRFMCLPEEAEA